MQTPEPGSGSVRATGEHQSRKCLDREMITPSCLLSQALQTSALQPAHAVDTHRVGQGLACNEVGLLSQAIARAGKAGPCAKAALRSILSSAIVSGH